MLATTLGVEFDSDKSWDEKKEVYRLSNKIVRTTNVTQTAVGDKRGILDHHHRRCHPHFRIASCVVRRSDGWYSSGGVSDLSS